MARAPISPILPSPQAQKNLLELAAQIMTEHRRFEDYYAKMEAVDRAYARYQANIDPATGVVSGQGIDAATTPVGVMDLPSTTPPVVVSQVDSMVAYLADVFLSGAPMFPVVSTPTEKEYAEQLEALIDDHATVGGYARQLLLFFRDGIKYNFSALEVPWESIDQYSTLNELLDPGKIGIKKTNKFYTKLRRLDPYNTIMDHNVAPGDVAAQGDYAGYISILSRTKLKRLLTRWGNDGEAINIKEALASNPYSTAESNSYRLHPQVSNYVSSRKPTTGINWYSYITGLKEGSSVSTSGNYELLTLYVRLVPSEMGLSGSERQTTQIWKLVIVNNQVIVQARRIISAYDYLPILFGQPLEDGLGYQTQSIAESNIPFQQAATTLFNIKFNSARRAVSDRALYDPTLISPTDINAAVPAPKIPVKTNGYDGTKRISDAYHQIPFDARGTESALQDGMTIVGFGKELSGLNAPMQGQFQRGNKSVQEWNDTMGGADARLRLPALTLEYQVFQPLKAILALNIFQYGDDAVIISEDKGKAYDIKIQELRTKVLKFKVADGYTPKSKLAGTDSLSMLMQTLSQSQILQQAYGPMLPSMFAHLASLMGVKNLDQYNPENNQPAAPPQAPTPQGVATDVGASIPEQSQPIEGSQGDML